MATQPYQEITAKALTLKGFVRIGIVESVSSESWSTGLAQHISPPGRTPWNRAVINPRNRHPLGLLLLDSDPDPRVTEITVIVCTATKPESIPNYEYSLALVPTDRENEYKRIGILIDAYLDHRDYDVAKRIPNELWEGRCWKTITVV
jgi:hypothetical protein